MENDLNPPTRHHGFTESSDNLLGIVAHVYDIQVNFVVAWEMGEGDRPIQIIP